MSRQSNWIKRWVSTPYLRVRIFHGMPFNTMNVSENITVNLLINKIKAKTAICFLIGNYLLKVRVLLPATYAGIAQLVERQYNKKIRLVYVEVIQRQNAKLIISSQKFNSSLRHHQFEFLNNFGYDGSMYLYKIENNNL